MSYLIPLEQLKLEYSNNIFDIPYQKLLLTLEWKSFRDKIEKRDNGKCLHCDMERKTIEIPFSKEQLLANRQASTITKKKLVNDIDRYRSIVSANYRFFPDTVNFAIPQALIKDIHLEVHHKYYINNFWPWDYETDALITLCRECHQKEHDEKHVKCFSTSAKEEIIQLKNCQKCKGSGYLAHYDYYQNGVCFDCNGWGFIK